LPLRQRHGLSFFLDEKRNKKITAYLVLATFLCLFLNSPNSPLKGGSDIVLFLTENPAESWPQNKAMSIPALVPRANECLLVYQ